MDIPPLEEERTIMQWDETDVSNWFASLGYPQYEDRIREHNVSGDVLCILDQEGLRAVGIATIGQRLAILKAVYLVKIDHNVPIESDHYVPPSEISERVVNLSLDGLRTIIKELAQRIQNVEEDNHYLHGSLQSLQEKFSALRQSVTQSGESSPLHRRPSLKRAQSINPQTSPTKLDHNLESLYPSPQQLEHDILPPGSNPEPSQLKPQISDPVEKHRPPPIFITDTDYSQTPQTPKPNRQEGLENLNRNYKLNLDDPTWKVLPAALKKYHIIDDGWQNYALFIVHGSAGSRTERCLSYDEKPLLLFQNFKDANMNPIFMLKHIREIRSPIAIAQQKYAGRKASSAMLSPQVRWPEPSILSPAIDMSTKGDDISRPIVRGSISSIASTATNMSGTTIGASFSENDTPITRTPEPTDVPMPNNVVSYAVAIYPYMAEQEDEFDTFVGDTFVILSRARGWWVVQRDPTGSGTVDQDKQGWVPAGCLLETNVPIASAIAEAMAAKGSASGVLPGTPASKAPILTLRIISTSVPSIALMDYRKNGDEELHLVKDDVLRVFKQYNHWSYVAKEDGGDRGWVPSWFIGKLKQPVGDVPKTSSGSVLSHLQGSF